MKKKIVAALSLSLLFAVPSLESRVPGLATERAILRHDVIKAAKAARGKATTDPEAATFFNTYQAYAAQVGAPQAKELKGELYAIVGKTLGKAARRSSPGLLFADNEKKRKRLEGELTTLRGKSAAEIAAKDREIAARESVIVLEKGKVQKAIADLTAKTGEVTRLNQEIGQLRGEVKRLGSGGSAITQSQYDALENRFNAAERALATAQSEAQSLRAQVSMLGAGSKGDATDPEAVKKLQQALENIRNKENELGQLRGRVQALEAQVSAAGKDKKAFSDEERARAEENLREFLADTKQGGQKALATVLLGAGSEDKLDAYPSLKDAYTALQAALQEEVPGSMREFIDNKGPRSQKVGALKAVRAYRARIGQLKSQLYNELQSAIQKQNLRPQRVPVSATQAEETLRAMWEGLQARILPSAPDAEGLRESLKDEEQSALQELAHSPERFGELRKRVFARQNELKQAGKLKGEGPRDQRKKKGEAGPIPEQGSGEAGGLSIAQLATLDPDVVKTLTPKDAAALAPAFLDLQEGIAALDPKAEKVRIEAYNAFANHPAYKEAAKAVDKKRWAAMHKSISEKASQVS